MLINEQSKQIQMPTVFNVDYSGDRSLYASFQPPCASTQQILGDLFSTYDKFIKPMVEPNDEINELFQIDENEIMAKHVASILEEGIDEHEQRDYLDHEVTSIYQQAIQSNIEKANVRLDTDLAISVPQFKLLTGQIQGYNAQISQLVQDTLELKQDLLKEEELDQLLRDIDISDSINTLQAEVNTATQLHIIHKALEAKNIAMNRNQERGTGEESKNKFQSNNEIDKALIEKRKYNQSLIEKQQEAQQIKDAQILQNSQIIEKNMSINTSSSIDFAFKDHNEDEIEFIVQDNRPLREQIESNRIEEEKFKDSTMQIDTTLNGKQQNATEINKKWFQVDELDVRRFQELVPNMVIEYPFELDEFQKRAIYRLEQNCCVFVAAHTSAGKTVVAEYAIALAFKHATKTIYTSPIKALSNQKFREFKDLFGDVGIRTGDVTLNGSASCVVMTTEILQQMIYNESDFLKDVEWVIFDEVHYINNEVRHINLKEYQQERGTVWEEVIMKLPDHINFVMLSATVPNYKEFAEWVGRTKRKQVYVQMTEKRPVPLQHKLLYKDKLSLAKDESGRIQIDEIKKVLKEEEIHNRSKGREDNKTQKEELKQDGDKKEIDFKEKARKAKDHALQKAASKGMKQANSGGGVVFCFARSECTDIPNQLPETLEFTTGEEKGKIKNFLKSKLQRLSELDRELPQIKSIKGLLVRGIGIHHAGMLPIVKELVEILFSDGFLKVIFATTTFAIGLNMPARSVFFTKIMKWNGNESALLETSEYLQMAGRAGRRGKDQFGTCILSIDRTFGQVPKLDQFEQILANQGDRLESKLRLSYQFALNVVQSDDLVINEVLKQSFFENENEKERVITQDKVQKLQIKIQRAQYIECECASVDELQTVHGIYQGLCDVNRRIFTVQRKDFVQMGIIQVITPRFVFQNLVVIQEWTENKDELICLYINQNYRESNLYSEYEQLFENTRLNFKGFNQNNVYYELVTINIRNVVKLYSNVIKLSSKVNLGRGGQIPVGPLKDIIFQFLDMRIFQEWKLGPMTNKEVKEQKVLLDSINQFKCIKCPKISAHLTQIACLDSFTFDLVNCKSLLDDKDLEKSNDFSSKINVLMHYGYLDKGLNQNFKGRVFQTFSTNQFLLTELIFSGLLIDLSDEELIALISTLETQNRSKVDESEAKISESFQAALNFLVSEAEKFMQAEREFKVSGANDDITKLLCLQYYEILYHWASQKSFAEVVKIQKVDEGNIVKVVQNVARLLTHMKNAARVIGDGQLAQRMDNCAVLIKRDIIFTPSLYLE
ncbi:dead deah box helicase family protein [Stylonychia lemnae]|uniref:Dead deah box helicase family protein n=1 Tax=Stylonychia lemnae TaxID=5949 RepID=A0A078B4Z5_STYLE|nr:dead deah box helicase family protein [Stylonychia lemnae]|eukprot:CDW89600.1 dead deah box helicase family protein [Stylonychia lemnae]